jgi:hypothetical protein
MVGWAEPIANAYAGTDNFEGRKRVSQNRMAVVLALIVLAIIIIGWVAQLAGGYMGPYEGSLREEPHGSRRLHKPQ